MWELIKKLLIARQITFEEGHIEFLKQKVAFVPIDFLTELTKKTIEKGKKDMLDLYWSAWFTGYDITLGLTRVYKLNKFEERYKVAMDGLSMLGFGSYKTLEFKRGEFSKFVTFTNPLALQLYPSNNPVDHILRGFNAGGGTAVHETLMNCVEVECAAQNKKQCLFVNGTTDYLKKYNPQMVETQLDLKYLIPKQIDFLKKVDKEGIIKISETDYSYLK